MDVFGLARKIEIVVKISLFILFMSLKNLEKNSLPIRPDCLPRTLSRFSQHTYPEPCRKGASHFQPNNKNQSISASRRGRSCPKNVGFFSFICHFLETWVNPIEPLGEWLRELTVIPNNLSRSFQPQLKICTENWSSCLIHIRLSMTDNHNFHDCLSNS